MWEWSHGKQSNKNGLYLQGKQKLSMYIAHCTCVLLESHLLQLLPVFFRCLFLGLVLPSLSLSGRPARYTHAWLEHLSMFVLQAVTVPHASGITFTYHSTPHHLFVGAKPCTYTTEVCSQNATTSTPCNYQFPAAGLNTSYSYDWCYLQCPNPNPWQIWLSC